MRSQKIMSILLVVLMLVSFVGCEKSTVKTSNNSQLYFFDSTRGMLVTEALPDEVMSNEDYQEQVKYVIGRMKENKSLQVATLQAGPQMPIQNTIIKDRVVAIYFSEAYNELLPQDKIGMRAALVYSLCDLEFINGVEFYVNNVPLTTTTGKMIGTIYKSDINADLLDPNPATTPYTLSVYFANNEGKLVKEEHSIRISNPNAVEKPLLEELIKGPNSADLLPTVPTDMKIKDASTVNGVCQIDLSFDTKSKFFTDNQAKELMVYSIVNSLTSLPHIKKVVIFIDGKNDVEFTPDIDFTDTFERSENYISQ